MRWVFFLLLALPACPAPHQYAVVRPGLTCDRATRVARRTVLEIGYKVTALVPATADHPGEITATKTLADGTSTTGRVRIRCDANAGQVSLNTRNGRIHVIQIVAYPSDREHAVQASPRRRFSSP